MKYNRGKIQKFPGYCVLRNTKKYQEILKYTEGKSRCCQGGGNVRANAAPLFNIVDFLHCAEKYKNTKNTEIMKCRGRNPDVAKERVM